MDKRILVLTDFSEAALNTAGYAFDLYSGPVLSISEDVTFSPPKEIVFPTDYNTPFKRRELKYLLNIVQMHQTSIQVVHVKESDTLNKVQHGNKKLLETLFRNVRHGFHELENLSVHKGINTFIDSRGSDIVAFINQKRNFFSRIMAKPLVKELGYQSKFPVLVLRHRI